jgi:threonine synthase
MQLICTRCAEEYPFDLRRFRCECEGPLEVAGAPRFEHARIEEDEFSLWRYRHALPLPAHAAAVTLGEGWTPLVAVEWDGLPIYLKCEPLNPTGSFKDRGTTVLATALVAAGAEQVVEDSSGNAGASLAAYAARAGVEATIYVPAHASPVKQAQIAVYGANLVTVPGPRTETARAVLQAAEKGAVYASHVYHPLIHHGMKTVAFELYEQLNSLQIANCRFESAICNSHILLPLGHGSLLLGLALGFEELERAGCIEGRPRIYGVQAAACAPLATAWEQGLEQALPVQEGETVAEGVRIAVPARDREILNAVRSCGGEILAVEDDRTLVAQRKLAQQGVYVEPTSALPLAALDTLRDSLEGAPVVVLLTGSGFKTPPAS